MTPETVDLVFKALAAIALAMLAFVFGLASAFVQKRHKSIEDTIADVAILKVKLADLTKENIPAMLQKHTLEIEALSGQLEDLSTAVESVRSTTTHIDKTMGSLAADSANTRQALERIDGHLMQLMRERSNPPQPGR